MDSVSTRQTSRNIKQQQQQTLRATVQYSPPPRPCRYTFIYFFYIIASTCVVCGDDKLRPVFFLLLSVLSPRQYDNAARKIVIRLHENPGTLRLQGRNRFPFCITWGRSSRKETICSREEEKKQPNRWKGR